MLIFVLQTIWLYIAELAGKDLDISVIGKFLLYLTPTLIPLILPLTILLASIMVFGNFAENYEFAAMKSTGISLQRAMRSLSAFIILLGITTFFFSNNVIPSAQYNSYNLRKNIAKLKPEMAIAEGQFNQIGSMNIKVSEKTEENGRKFLKDVVIHKSATGNPRNNTVILSNTGELISSKESDVLQLVLYDGNYYDEIESTDFKQKRKKPFVKSEFKEYTINVDLGEINGNVDLEQKQVTSKYDMLSIGDLDYTIDSLRLKEVTKLKTFSKDIYARAISSGAYKKDSLTPSKLNADIEKDFLDLFNTKEKIQIIDAGINKTLSTNQVITGKDRELSSEEKWKNKHIIAYHEKFALGFACIILFFVGAPLGALIKKGGIGLPMVIAIVLFLLYHFIGIFAKNSAEDGSLNPALASWLSTLIMFPVSIYLTSRATKDRGLFDVDLLLQPIINQFKSKDSIVIFKKGLKTISDDEFEKFKSYDNDKLIDVIKNYRRYDYDESYKIEALKILDYRGITEQELKIAGKLTNDDFETAKRHYLEYNLNSKIAFFFYFPYLVFLLVYFIFKNNNLSSLATISLIIAVPSIILFLIFLMKSFANQSDFNKVVGKKFNFNAFVLVIFGIPLYVLIYFFNKKIMKEDLKAIH